MQQLPEFVANHSFLVLIFVMVTGLLLWNLFGGMLQNFEQLAPLEAIQLINHEEALVLDVREENEYSQGHILNSAHVPLGSLNNNLKRLEKYRERSILISCLSGHRSGQACNMLKKNGFEKVYNLRGGMTAWRNADLPVASGKKGALKL